jgi:4-aminobutyrate aminotransferase-like enzyme/Ser/Thr protein kinase RdoA (MazF antagonist)
MQQPIFTIEDASRLALDLFGLEASARVLPGEYDHNFHMKSADGSEFVLKIAPTGAKRDVLDLQNRALEHLAARDPSLGLQKVYATITGETITTTTDADHREHFVRLLSYVPGCPLAKVKPHTSELLQNLGSLMGKVDHALQDFEHPAAHRALKWNLPGALWIRDYLSYIELPERRALVEGFLSRFEKDVLPVLPALRTSIIHDDANDYNVLVGDVNTSSCRVGASQPRPGDDAGSGRLSVIDYGDMIHTQLVCEPAIAAAYAMMNKPDPLAAAAAVVKGYAQIFPLTETELAVLYPLICVRLCISVVNSAYQRSVEPHNEYLTISEQPAWALLEQLADIHPRLAHYVLRDACQLPACPHTGAIVDWLASNAGTLGHIVEPDLRVSNNVIFDLSIGSREIGNMAEVFDVEQFTRNLFGRMRAANSAVGIGRYNEARPIYTSEHYRLEGNNGPEWRTIHIGLDVFMEAGAPVFAPLDGVVHSFRNNTPHLDYGPTIILQHTVADGQMTFFTLYGHLSADSLHNLYEGKPIAKDTPFASIGDATINGGWPPHLHFQIITDMLDRVGDFPGVARPAQRATWLSLSPDPNLIARIPAADFPSAGRSVEQIRRARAAHIGKALSISYQHPLKIVRGWMQYLYDEDGHTYLDAVNNVSHVGHSHPRVVKAGQEQMAVLNTNTRYLHDYLVEYAERLCATLPEPLSVCFFVCSGSEANELALRLARAHTQRKDIIVVDVAYHGNTTTLVEISPYKFDGPGGAGAPAYVHKVPMPDVYRGRYKSNDAQAGRHYARSIEETLRELEQQRPAGAFICESLLGCGGQIVLPEGYLQEAYRSVREAGGVCIADEVQVGFGRVGTHFWGFETQGVVPDIVTMGKPIGNGHPLAAVVTTPEIADSFNNGMEYFNTFGGNPVSCAIGLAVLDVIAEEQLQQHALRVGNHLMDGLRGLMQKHELIGDVRGLGLFVGIELVLDRQTLAPAAALATYIANRMRERGILLSTDGPFHNVLKIKPPLVFTAANADFLVATLDEILAEDFASSGRHP